MSREKKDGIKKTYYIEKALAEKLKTFCAETGRTETKVVELSVKEYLTKHVNDHEIETR